MTRVYDFPCFEDGTDLLAWLQSPLDPARIEEQREPAAVTRPELLVEFQKRIGDRLADGIEQVDVPVSLAPAHRRREVNVEPQQIFRQDLRRWVDQVATVAARFSWPWIPGDRDQIENQPGR